MLTQLLVNGLAAGAAAALLAGGFSILYSASRFFVFTFGASYTVAAYTALVVHGSAPYWAGALLGVLFAAALGLALEVTVYGPVRRRGNAPLVLMLASIGLYTILQNLVSLLFGDTTRTVRDWSVREGIAFFGARITHVQLLIVAASGVLLLAVWGLLAGSAVGLRLRAVLRDAELARIVGVNVDKTVMVGAAVGSALAGAAAVLVSMDTDLVPTMGFDALLIAVVGAVVGGISSVKGAALGGLLVGLLKHLGVWKLPTQWQDAILFLLLLVILVVRPHGLLTRATARSRR